MCGLLVSDVTVFINPARYMLHKKTVLVKKRHSCVKKLHFYKLSGCKNTAFLQKYIFVKKAAFLQVTWL